MKRLFSFIVLLTMFLGAKAVEVTDVEVDFSKYKDISDVHFYSWGASESAAARLSIQNGCLHFHSEEATVPSWDCQFFPIGGVAAELGVTYTLHYKVKGSVAQNCSMLGFGQTPYGMFQITTEWVEGYIDYECIEENGNIIMQCGNYVGDFDIAYLKITHEVYGDPIEWSELLTNGDAEADWVEPNTMFNDLENNYKICVWTKEKGINVHENGASIPHPAEIVSEANGNRVFICRANAADTDGEASNWDNQIWLESPRVWTVGEQFKISFRYKASEPVMSPTQVHGQMPSEYLFWRAIGDIAFTTEWQMFEQVVTVDSDQDGMWSIAFNLNTNIKTPVDFYIDDLSWSSVDGNKERLMLERLIAECENAIPDPSQVMCEATLRGKYIDAMTKAKNADRDYLLARDYLYNSYIDVMESINYYAKVPSQIAIVEDACYKAKKNGWLSLSASLNAHARNVSNGYDKGTLTISDIEGIIPVYQNYMREFLIELRKEGNDMSGEDITDRIINHSFEDYDGTGWNYTPGLTSIHGGFEEFACAEAYEMPFEVYQDIEGVENGLYKVTVNSFYRPGSNGTYNGEESVPVQLMLNDFYTPVQHILSDVMPVDEANDQFNCYITPYTANEGNFYSHGSGSDFTDWLHSSGYVPNGMTGASVAFVSGRYKQTVYGLVEDGKLRLGLTSMNKKAHWCLWSNIRLYYMGKDSTALAAVIKNYIERAEHMIDTINCENKNIVVRSLESGINRAELSLGKDEDTMYNALIYLNGCIKNYLENMEDFVVRMREYQSLYATACSLSSEVYSGYNEFQLAMRDAKTYFDNEFESLDDNYDDLEYINVAIDELSKAINAYKESMNVPFPQEVSLLTSAVPSVKGYEVKKSHIVSVDISSCGLKSLPLELFSLPGLVSVNASHNNISTIYIPNEYKEILSGIDINLQYQDIDKTVDIDYDRIVDYQSLLLQVPILPYYDFATNSFMANGMAIKASTQCPTMENENNWAISAVYSAGLPDFHIASDGDNAYYGNSGDTLYITYPLASNAVEGSFYRARFFFEQGDANFINGVDATDLQTTILYAFGGYRNYPFNFTAADTYKDGFINVQDVICTVNVLLDSNNEPISKANKQVGMARMASKAMTDTDAYLYIQDGKVFLHSRVPVASLSIKADGNVKWNIERFGLMQSTANGNVVAYSLSGATIPSNEDVVLGECKNASLYSVSLSDAEAQPISVAFVSDNTTSIISTSETTNEDTKIYDVSGYNKNSLGNGINIIRRNGTTKKVYQK